MKIELKKEYVTGAHQKAVILYRQPSDVQDEYPLVGYVVTEGGKIGVCWSNDGYGAESIAFDLIGEWGPQYE